MVVIYTSQKTRIEGCVCTCMCMCVHVGITQHSVEKDAKMESYATLAVVMSY